MFVKIHKTYRDVIAICDFDLIGKFFEEGKSQLDIKESFYKGEEKTPEEVEKLMEYMSGEDATFNIVGNESVDLALKVGIISESGVGEIQGVKFALILA